MATSSYRLHVAEVERAIAAAIAEWAQSLANELDHQLKEKARMDRHYIIVRTPCPGGNPATFAAHPTFGEALLEATRLAEKNPGENFIVYRSQAIAVGRVHVAVAGNDPA